LPIASGVYKNYIVKPYVDIYRYLLFIKRSYYQR